MELKGSDSFDQEIEIPVMFGDGRVRRINYVQIKSLHTPTLLVTEVLSFKDDLEKYVERAIAAGQSVNQVTVNKTMAVLTQLALESAQAIAEFGGNRWIMEPGQEIPSEERLVLITHQRMSTGLGTNYNAVLRVLKGYEEELRQKEDARAQSLQGNIQRIEHIVELAKNRTDPIVEVYPRLDDPSGYFRNITFIGHPKNLRYFSMWKATELEQLHYDFFFSYNGEEIVFEPWRYLIEKYFPHLENLAEPIESNKMKDWHEGKITSQSDLTIEEYKDAKNGRWIYRNERRAGTNMVVRVSFDFDHGNQANIQLLEELLPLVPQILLDSPGTKVW